MRTLFTSEDVKNYAEYLFNGNLRANKVAGVPYENENSEVIDLNDDGQITQADLAEYLNIRFYNWKNRVVEKGRETITDSAYEDFDDWVQSLNLSLYESYALVEKIDEEVTASQDIDNALITSRITFIIQADKIKNLDYYVTKIRNKFLGVPQDIQNSFGDVLKAYILLGALTYAEEPFATQYGECIICTSVLKIEYLTDALTYDDTKVEISLDGDDLYDEYGQIVDENGDPATTKYLTMPITKATFQNMFTNTALATQRRPDLTGFVVTSLSTAKTLTFYDFNKPLTESFNGLFWAVSANKIDGVEQSAREVNVPVWIRVTCGGHFYVYKDVIENMQKTLTNNSFNVSSITLKGWGKLGG